MDPRDWDSYRQELREAERRIFEHPGYLEHLECEALRITLYVVARNCADLLALLDKAATDEKLAIELIQNVRPPTVREAFQNEVSRLLHNYVASAMTLVDHSRRLLGNRSDAIASGFKERRTTLLTNPEMRFVQELRNFALHRTLPYLGHTLQWDKPNTAEEQMTSEVQLSVSQLASWDGWSPASRDFLAKQGDAVNLRPMVRKHSQLLLEINAWLHDSLLEANRMALGEVNRAIRDLNTFRAGGAPEADS